MQQRQPEQRRAHLVKCDFRQARVRTVEIVGLEPHVQREQRLIRPSIDTQRIVR